MLYTILLMNTSTTAQDQVVCCFPKALLNALNSLKNSIDTMAILNLMLTWMRETHYGKK